MSEVRVDNRTVDHFNIRPEDALEWRDKLESIVNRLSHSDGNYRRCLLYLFTEEELDTLSEMIECLILDPVFKNN